jgi:PIN domain nuclease of toxin-antitoxin system
VIADTGNSIHASAASAREIATKQRIGKLDEVPEAAKRYGELIDADGFIHLPLTHLHALRAGGWQVAHRDPFDRMLAAQSILERMPLVTGDPAFEQFGIQMLW